MLAVRQAFFTDFFNFSTAVTKNTCGAASIFQKYINPFKRMPARGGCRGRASRNLRVKNSRHRTQKLYYGFFLRRGKL